MQRPPERDIILLLALPASGKSEIRRYLDHDETAARLGLGTAVHLDDYPYVHLMRLISDELHRRAAPPVFFRGLDRPFIERRDWSTLTALLDNDVHRVLHEEEPRFDGAAGLLERLDSVRGRFGIDPAFRRMDPSLRSDLETAIDVPAKSVAQTVADAAAAWTPGTTTLVVEFAVGGPVGATVPLPAPMGYRHALSLLSPKVVRRAMLLYVWATPGQSRTRNRARARPGPEGEASILHHGVSEAVMREDYGCDDVSWLLAASEHPETVEVPGPDGPTPIPAVRLDNRVDLTSHLRGSPDTWDPVKTSMLHDSLEIALDRLRTAARRLDGA